MHTHTRASAAANSMGVTYEEFVSTGLRIEGFAFLPHRSAAHTTHEGR